MSVEQRFLEWNIGNIFENLLQAESHYRNIEEDVKTSGPFLSCIVKHLAIVAGEADEAFSHSLIVENIETATEYAKIRNRARELYRQIQSGNIDVERGIKEIRALRTVFEHLNKSFDTSQCKSCGLHLKIPDELRTALSAAHEIDSDLMNIDDERSLSEDENDYVRSVIGNLSEKYGVPPPKVIFDNGCYEPNKGRYSEGQLRICRGGANNHVLTHEFGHHLQYLRGASFNESEAERFARNEIAGTGEEKRSYWSIDDKNDEDESDKMSEDTMAPMDIALLFSGIHVGKGISVAMESVDVKYPKAVAGLNPSAVVALVGAVVGAIAAYKLKTPLSYLILGIGGMLSTDLWKLIPEASAGAVATKPSLSNNNIVTIVPSNVASFQDGS